MCEAYHRHRARETEKKETLFVFSVNRIYGMRNEKIKWNGQMLIAGKKRLKRCLLLGSLICWNIQFHDKGIWEMLGVFLGWWTRKLKKLNKIDFFFLKILIFFKEKTHNRKFMPKR